MEFTYRSIDPRLIHHSLRRLDVPNTEKIRASRVLQERLGKINYTQPVLANHNYHRHGTWVPWNDIKY